MADSGKGEVKGRLLKIGLLPALVPPEEPRLPATHGGREGIYGTNALRHDVLAVAELFMGQGVALLFLQRRTRDGGFDHVPSDAENLRPEFLMPVTPNRNVLLGNRAGVPAAPFQVGRHFESVRRRNFRDPNPRM